MFNYNSNSIDKDYIRAALNSTFEFIKHGNALNIGVGYGTADEVFSKEFEEYTSIDLEQSVIDNQKEMLSHVNYICSDFFQFQAGTKFDTIIASHILEHVENYEDFLNRCYDLLKPKGRLIVIVPNAESIHRKIGVEMGFLKDITELNDADKSIGHTIVFTPKRLKREFERTQFNILKLKTVTLKAFSYSQLLEMPSDYIKACLSPNLECSSFGSQIVSILEKEG